MSGFMDMEGWKRSWGPAMRVFSYISGLFVLLFLVVVLPIYIIVVGFGLPMAIYNQVAGMLMFLGVAFSIPLAFFKVQDEMSPGIVPLEMSK